MAETRRDDANPSTTDPAQTKSPDPNRDPITGEPGAHPVGAGVGAAVGGAAAGVAGGALGGMATGATAGTTAGPIGTVVGAVVGGVVGGLAGKGIAESINPTDEDAYWRENYASRPYYDKAISYDEYRPAYQHGWESRARYEGKTFDEAEPHLQREWDTVKAKSNLTWEKAKHASRDAWDRVERSVTGRQHDSGNVTAGSNISTATGHERQPR
jgi:hypothetical protein